MKKGSIDNNDNNKMRGFKNWLDERVREGLIDLNNTLHRAVVQWLRECVSKDVIDPNNPVHREEYMDKFFLVLAGLEEYGQTMLSGIEGTLKRGKRRGKRKGKDKGEGEGEGWREGENKGSSNNIALISMWIASEGLSRY